MTDEREPFIDLEQVKSDIAALRADIQALAEGWRARGCEAARDGTRAARAQVQSTFASAGAFVEKRPIACVLAILGAGVVAGMLSSRRK